MNLINAMINKNLVLNTKGGLYHKSTFDANLDFFCGINRYNDVMEIKEAFAKAFIEDNVYNKEMKYNALQ